jgi:hypothetical protein
MAKPARYMMRVSKGALVPADGYTERQLRAKGYRIGDVVSVAITKARNPKYWRLAHAFGQMLAENIERFEGVEEHEVLKLLQIEANVACDLRAIFVPGYGLCEHRTPRSLSFADMEEGEFRDVMRAFSRHVAATYWPDLSPEQIERMAELMPQEVTP